MLIDRDLKETQLADGQMAPADKTLIGSRDLIGFSIYLCEWGIGIPLFTF